MEDDVDFDVGWKLFIVTVSLVIGIVFGVLGLIILTYYKAYFLGSIFLLWMGVCWAFGVKLLDEKN